MLFSDPPHITIYSVATSCIYILFISIPAGSPQDGGLFRLQHRSYLCLNQSYS